MKPHSHFALVGAMVCITLLWSSAGLISRQITHAGAWDIAFWRSALTALFTGLYWYYERRAKGMATDLQAGKLLWASSACWAMMFTCFMLAMSFTLVSHVLLAMSVGPFLTALLARLCLGHKILPHTWWAAFSAGAGLAYMFASDLSSLSATQSGHSVLLGVLIAFCVPIAAAVNFIVLQHSASKRIQINLMPAVCLGALLSALLCLPATRLLAPSGQDFLWLLVLALFQLSIPCVWVVWVSARLAAAQVSLLQILEVVFGTIWVWLWAGETPSFASILGGSVVVTVLLVHGAWELYLAKKINHHQ